MNRNKYIYSVYLIMYGGIVLSSMALIYYYILIKGWIIINQEWTNNKIIIK